MSSAIYAQQKSSSRIINVSHVTLLPASNAVPTTPAANAALATLLIMISSAFHAVSMDAFLASQVRYAVTALKTQILYKINANAKMDMI